MTFKQHLQHLTTPTSVLFCDPKTQLEVEVVLADFASFDKDNVRRYEKTYLGAIQDTEALHDLALAVVRSNGHDPGDSSLQWSFRVHYRETGGYTRGHVQELEKPKKNSKKKSFKEK